jgi:hypothetical protein
MIKQLIKHYKKNRPKRHICDLKDGDRAYICSFDVPKGSMEISRYTNVSYERETSFHLKMHREGDFIRLNGAYEAIRIV